MFIWGALCHHMTPSFNMEGLLYRALCLPACKVCVVYALCVLTVPVCGVVIVSRRSSGLYVFRYGPLDWTIACKISCIHVSYRMLGVCVLGAWRFWHSDMQQLYTG